MSQQAISTLDPRSAQQNTGAISQTLSALRLLLVLTLITGVLYPVVMTLVGQIVFPFQANGSLEMVNGVVVGSDLIGQSSNDPRYFQSRPSAVNAMQGSYFNSEADKSIGSSGASNLSPSSAALQGVVVVREAEFRAFNSLPADAVVPADMIFASGSGLDPHISPEAAALQVARIAEVRGMTVARVESLVAEATEGPQFGIFGQPRVNVLKLNRALDREA